MVGILLLTYDNCYLVDGKIPKRPIDDKLILKQFCEDAAIICSENTEVMLPPSIRKVAKGVYTNPQDIAELLDSGMPIVNLGISTLDAYKPDVLFVVRSDHLGKKCKQFRLTEYKKIFTVYTSVRTIIDVYKPI